MGKILTLSRRELAAYFYSPLAYVLGGLYLAAISLWFFQNVFIPGQEASLKPLFEAMAYVMAFAAPLLTMRLVSDEFRSGTIETLMTAPITDVQVVVGKFLGVLVFYLLLLAVTLVYLVLMLVYGQPDPGVVATGYLGMVLLGAAYLAVGLFTSTLTRYQLLAAVVGVAILALFSIVMQLLSLHSPSPIRDVAASLNAMAYFRDFAMGFLDTRGVMYFLSTVAIFLFLSVKTLESRRWR